MKMEARDKQEKASPRRVKCLIIYECEKVVNSLRLCECRMSLGRWCGTGAGTVSDSPLAWHIFHILGILNITRYMLYMHNEPCLV